MKISDDDFEALIARALDSLPQDYVQAMLKDVAVTWEHKPSEEQRTRQNLKPNETLYGLYEGVPRPDRSLLGFGPPQLPDKITIFKGPLCAANDTAERLHDAVKKTVWHEMAHYFGLGHKRIHELE